MSDKDTYDQQREASDNTFDQGVPFIFQALDLDIGNLDYTCEVSSFFVDTKKSTDLVIKKKGIIEKMVAYRMRTAEYIDRYPDQVTFRSANIHNVPTEFLKIMQGMADVGFYGFTNENGKVVRWILISFDGLRYVHTYNKEQGLYLPDKNIYRYPGKNKGPDGTSFWGYNVRSFLAHDNNPTTEPEHKIILGHSLGYFEDLLEIPNERKGCPSSYIMKDIIDRIDR